MRSVTEPFELSLIPYEKDEFPEEITPRKAMPWNVAFGQWAVSWIFREKRLTVHCWLPV